MNCSDKPKAPVENPDSPSESEEIENPEDPGELDLPEQDGEEIKDPKTPDQKRKKKIQFDRV